MQIPFPYENFNMYFINKMFKSQLISLIKLAFNNYQHGDCDKTYFQLYMNEYKSSIFCTSSKIALYKYLLFDYHADNSFYFNLIDYWLNDIEERERIYFKYTINNIIDEDIEYFKYDNNAYVDLISVFDKFFKQKFNDFYFELKEIKIINIIS